MHSLIVERIYRGPEPAERITIELPGGESRIFGDDGQLTEWVEIHSAGEPEFPDQCLAATIKSHCPLNDGVRLIDPLLANSSQTFNVILGESELVERDNNA